MTTLINMFSRLSQTDVLNLTNGVKETIADLKHHKPSKTFCAADLRNSVEKKRNGQEIFDVM